MRRNSNTWTVHFISPLTLWWFYYCDNFSEWYNAENTIFWSPNFLPFGGQKCKLILNYLLFTIIHQASHNINLVKNNGSKNCVWNTSPFTGFVNFVIVRDMNKILLHFFFLLVSLAVLINPWQKAPSPETFHFLFWLSLLQRLLYSRYEAYRVLRT